HGAMYGVPEFYKTCQKEGIHPIIGMEAYLCDDISVKPKKSNEYHHLLLLAETQQGYQNLIQLCTASHTWGFHYKPRIDKRLLAQHATGLIGTSSCLAGEIPGLLLSGQEQQACEAIRWYQDVFGENNFFLELQEHHDNTSEQTKLNKMLYQLHQEMHIEPIATNDLHYVEHDDHRAHDVLLCVQTGARLAEKDRFHFEGDEYYLRSPQEMYGLFGGAERACSNTVLIAERCNVDPFAKKAGLPSVEVPAAYASDYEWLRTLCLQGIQERFGEMTDEVQQKLDYELNIIAQKGFVPYFLIVWDFVNFARERGIRCSARGSAAGSLVAYTLGITNVDPLRYDLLFERFMNPERADMPDIDMDFADDRREEVIRYVSEKYGYDCVAQMVTFNTMAAKSSIKDVARTLNKPDLATTINGMFTDDTKKLQDVLEDSERLQKLLVADGEAKVLWNYAIALEGTVRSTGTHAAGVVVGNEPLTNFLPMRPKDHKAPDAGSETMYPQQYLEELGLIKFDFLGLSNYTVEDLTVRFVKETRGEEIDIERLPLDPTGDHELDEKRSKAFEVLAAGETTGVFQLESPKMREYIRQLKPTRIEDVTAMVALFRPGPMESIPDFIEAKHGRKKVQYLDPRLQTWLEESYGIIVYQDQVLLIAVNLAGFSWGKVNKFRKALSKKIQHEVEGYKSDFIAGCIKNNVKPHVAERLFELIKPFGGYGFNKAHAASYAVIAYQTAYLKANYPVEYMAAVLTKDMNSAKKIAKDVAECQHLKVQVLPPDINKSTMGFQAEDGKVRFGLLAIKGIGEGPIETILKERTCGGIFTSLIDFCERVALGQSAIETLIKAGAFDAFGERHVLLASVENIVKEGKSQRALRKSGQNTLFGEEIAVDL
ncbi:MAG TPA: DNA polymerase III subunit alpha, partial [Ktedonobacteraceae bacterium]